jgi:hypothetical protein
MLTMDLVMNNSTIKETMKYLNFFRVRFLPTQLIQSNRKVKFLIIRPKMKREWSTIVFQKQRKKISKILSRICNNLLNQEWVNIM